ncbi:c-type cytochrome [Bacillus sp. T3]|uniref:c-type cytochrome n=1 Tax=Bacillus sp. T3 TaxID=467262 RepID=UPI0029816974|nr:c-type cytochrome [Bacillus sp. T3]
MKKILIGIYILVTIGIIIVISNSSLLTPKNQKAIEAGERIYQQQCSACHGDNGKGQGAKEGTALNNQHFLNTYTDKDLFNQVKYGREGSVMPAYGANLSEEDINNVVAYMRNWQKKSIEMDVPEKISGDPESGKKHYDLFCASCHGIDGAGKKKMGTVLVSPQKLQYTTNEQLWMSTAYGREETRMGPSLKGLEGVRQLSKQDINDIVMYIRYMQGK